MSSSFVVRTARDTDAERITAIEADADRMLIDLFQAEAWPAPDSAALRLRAPGTVLVCASPSHDVVGFAHLLEQDGHAHHEQLSVLPRLGRRDSVACS